MQKNIIMDNAHGMAKIIYDIAQYRNDGFRPHFPAVAKRRPEKTENGFGPSFTKAILSLIIKQKRGGVNRAFRVMRAC
ncbi:hypothetical protein ABK905_02115 [Acerihabitans sp. KWT182]|uniref:Uncharacterized protein n=1 Tax=Acerihabitans sp. KWT182 TaxID=3157919 RepID=A0AAU7QAM2_9GAMM